jgi:hypothetical protein
MLATQIKELAETDTFAAALLADRGREFTDMEILVHMYHRSDERNEFREIRKYSRLLCEVFIEAVHSGDSKKIHEIANAVESIMKFKGGADPFRHRILMDKLIVGEGRKIAELAKVIGWPKSDKATGYPQLRRVCKELGYPIIPSRQIKGQKPSKNLDAYLG